MKKEEFRRKTANILGFIAVLFTMLLLLTELNKDNSTYQFYLFFTLAAVSCIVIMLIYILIYENKHKECYIKKEPRKIHLQFKRRKQLLEILDNSLLCNDFKLMKVEDNEFKNPINVYVKSNFLIYKIYLILELKEFDISVIKETINLVYKNLKKGNKIKFDYILTCIVIIEKATEEYNDFFSNCIEQKKTRYFLPVGIDISSKKLVIPIQKERLYINQYNLMIKELEKKLLEIIENHL